MTRALLPRRTRIGRFAVPAVALSIPVALLSPGISPSAVAASPGTSTLSAPTGDTASKVTWTGQFVGTGRVDTTIPCDGGGNVNCDRESLVLDIPADFWSHHAGSVNVSIDWASSADDLDMRVLDSAGKEVASSATSGGKQEAVDLGHLAPGAYTVEVGSWVAAPGTTYTGTATLGSTAVSAAMTFPETKADVAKELVQKYPLRVIFVGRTPSAAEIADLKNSIPTEYKATVANKSDSPSDIANTGAGLLNWNKQHYMPGENPYFLGIKFDYDLQILTASDDYTKALFAKASEVTARDQSFHNTNYGANLASYDASYGGMRVTAKNNDPAYKVADPTKTDVIDSYAVEDWMFASRTQAKWSCAFTNVETGKCVGANVIQDNKDAYHDPYYDKFGLNLNKAPQAQNKGTSYFFFDTFTPSFASTYFRPSAYHTWGTDKVIGGKIIPKAVEDGGSWRITDPDTGDWDGVDFARTWGGRYRFHFVDLGAAPNAYESATWISSKLPMSSDYPHGDPPIWQYAVDPRWKQSGNTCVNSPTMYTGDTPCRLMPRIGRSVQYGLMFRSTAGYLYRPVPRGDVYWLAVSNWTDFYSRPQTVNGQLTNAPYYGTWWMDMQKLYKIGNVADGTQQDDTLRWLSSATPYARWVGRKGETIPLYDPTSNQPTGKSLNTAPKYEDLPAPATHVYANGGTTAIVPEPLATKDHVVTPYGVDLTGVQEAIEKAKAYGFAGEGYDDAVNADVFRDFVDAHRPGIADLVPGVNTIPSVDVVFEKAYTWALPAIVGGIAEGTNDGEAWGVLNNVNDRFGACSAHYPANQPAGQPQSLTDQCLPTQETGTGFSYTIEHEAAHNLGLSHPHDGSYGVDKCPAGDPNAGQWKCYWNGLGWMFDISAAPTTYAMSYRPYEIEDQDNLQRGHVAEYLLGAQDALRDRLVAESAKGLTAPSRKWTADYNAMKSWRATAGTLFRKGDYLHAEYAARNASLAARGVPAKGRTVAPRLVEAGQLFYYSVTPQADRPIIY